MVIMTVPHTLRLSMLRMVIIITTAKVLIYLCGDYITVMSYDQITHHPCGN